MLHGGRPSCTKVVQLADLIPLNLEEQARRFPGTPLPAAVLVVSSLFIDNVSCAGSTPRSPIPESLHLLALRPIFTSSLSVLFQVMRRGRKG